MWEEGEIRHTSQQEASGAGQQPKDPSGISQHVVWSGHALPSPQSTSAIAAPRSKKVHKVKVINLMLGQRGGEKKNQVEKKKKGKGGFYSVELGSYGSKRARTSLGNGKSLVFCKVDTRRHFVSTSIDVKMESTLFL